VGASYADLGATVTDNVNDNLGIHVFLNGVAIDSINLDTSISSTHTIDYVATDQAGNTATSTRTVIIEPASGDVPDAPPPVPTDTPEEVPANSSASDDAGMDAHAEPATQPVLPAQ
jgi:hypothetical protein